MRKTGWSGIHWLYNWLNIPWVKDDDDDEALYGDFPATDNALLTFLMGG
jgi:hypothetical protein